MQAPERNADDSLRREARPPWLPLFFGVLALCLAAIGWFSYRTLADTVERDRTARLDAVAELKAKQIEDWLHERRIDVVETTAGALFGETLAQVRKGDATARNRMRDQLELRRRLHRYAAIRIFDPAGGLLLSVGETQPLAVDIPAIVARAASHEEPELIDVTRNEQTGELRLAYAGVGRAGDAAQGAIQTISVISVDPAEHLFPVIQDWPYPSASGETGLARREGDEIVFLNVPRNSGTRPLGLRLPMSDGNLPAVKAVLNGPGIHEGVDYRGVPAFVAARAIAGTPWLLLVKVDREEVFRDVRRLAMVSFALTLALIAACGLLLLLIWRQQRWREVLAREEAVMKSEARFGFLTGNMQEGFAYCRMLFVDDQPMDFIYLEVNPAFQKLTGLANVVGRPVSEIIPGIRAAAPELFAAYGRAARGGSPEHIEIFVEPLGDWYGISTYGAEPDCFVAIFEVITERKKAQAQIENERSRLRTLVQTIPDLVWLKDPDGIYILCNAAFSRFVGIPEDQIAGKTDYDMVPKELADFFREKDRQAVAAGRPSTNEEWVRFADDGHSALLETIKTPMRDGAGTLIGVLGIGRDITARRQAEDQLRKLWLAVEQSPNSIVITDVDGHIEYVNEACVKCTGYGRDELIGRNPSMLGSGQTPRHVYAELWAALRAGQTWQGEFINRRKNGETYIDFVRASPVRQPDGSISHYLAVQEDITERKRMGQELDRHRFHLEELVAERTAQLAAAREAAEVAARAKGAFVANMSHEIRTPLNAILGFTHLLRRHTRDPGQADKLAKIDDAGHHLLALINDILDFSKIEAGKVTLERRDFDLRALLEKVCALVREKAQEKGLELAVAVDPALPGTLHGDATRLSQALLNYASNAVKFSEHGRVLLSARLLDEAEGRLRVRFAVQDNGVGITPEVEARLFQDFEQADQSTTRKYGGTGLGLAITRRMAELMGGEVGVESKPGVGSTFSLTIPLARALTAAVSAEPEAASPQAEMALLREHYGARVLLAEDNRINREVALELLGEAGCRVDVAQNGAEAVEKARAEAYDLILMDIHMPVMDGLTATREIRALPGRADTPIVALTASAFSEDRQASLEAGMNDHLAKPFDPDTLFAVVLKWLPEAKQVPRAAPATHAAQPFLAPLPDISGLDVAAGLKSVQGRAATWLRLLRMYAEGHGEDATTLRQCIARDDRDGAMHLIHGIKGASATIGATRVVALAAELEQALRQGRGWPAMESAAAALGTELASLTAALRRALPAESVAARAGVVDSDATLARLEALLAEDDIEASRVFREAQPELRAALGAAAATLEHQIARYDYAAALATLRAAREESGPAAG